MMRVFYSSGALKNSSPFLTPILSVQLSIKKLTKSASVINYLLNMLISKAFSFSFVALSCLILTFSMVLVRIFIVSIVFDLTAP